MTYGPNHRPAPATFNTEALPPHCTTMEEPSPRGNMAAVHHQCAGGWNTPQPQRTFANFTSWMCWQLRTPEWRTGDTRIPWPLPCIASPSRAATMPKHHKCLLPVFFGDPPCTDLSCLPCPHVQNGCSTRAIICFSLEVMGTSSSNVNRCTVDYWRDMPLYWAFSSRGFFFPPAQEVQSWYLKPVSVIK